MKTHIVILTLIFKFSLCRDFFVGMFKKNDLLVAQDTLYKEKNYFGFATAKYGRVFHCPITYFRVSDRLGVGRPPAVTITRGGLQKKYITIRLTSSYNTPIAVNIYIGCENKLTTKIRTTATTVAKIAGSTNKGGSTASPEEDAKGSTTSVSAAGDDAEATTAAADTEEATTGDDTNVAEEAEHEDTTPAPQD